MIDYEEEWLVPILFHKKGSVFVNSFLFAFPAAACAFVLPLLTENFPEELSHLGVQSLGERGGLSVLWSAMTTVLVFVVTFRTSQGYARFWEGTGLLHRMKGEWFDTVSNCITFTIHTANKDESKRPAVDKFRHTLVRLMSLCHGSALEEISGMNGQLEVIDCDGLNRDTKLHINNCVQTHKFNKVEVLVHLVQSVITDAADNGVIQVPAPILSRVYQTISRGYVNLLNTKKITDTKFPFPFAQAIALLLFTYSLLTPLAICANFWDNKWAPLFSFIPVFGLYALNAISIELENPFGDDDNDLPLADFQAEMNSCLLMLMHPNTDIIAGVGPHCVLNFEELKASVTLDDEEGEGHGRPAGDKGDAPSPPKQRRLSNVHLFDASFDASSLEADAARVSNQSPVIDVSESVEVKRAKSEDYLPSEGDGVSNSPSARLSCSGPGVRLPPVDHLELDDIELRSRLVASTLASTAAFSSSLTAWRAKMEEQVKEMCVHVKTISAVTRRNRGDGGPS